MAEKKSEEWFLKAEKFEEEGELDGVIDLHIHIGPELRPRYTDAIDLARRMRDQGMRAFLIKPMVFPSIDKAYFAEKHVPGIRVFGGLKLCHAVGALNVKAVDSVIRMGGKSVWLPTQESILHLDEAAKKRAPVYYGKGYPIPKDVSGAIVAVKNGKIVPEMEAIFNRLAESKDVIFGTSHVSPEHSLVLIDAAKSIGVEKITVTHPNAPLINASIDQMKEMAEKGAYIELNFAYTYGIYGGQDPAFLAEAIKAVGPRRCLMVTDSGQTPVPSPPEVMRNYIRSMKLKGITQSEIDIMTKKNPAYLLGL